MEDKRRDLCRYRLEKAEKCLVSAQMLKNSGDLCSAVNRSYYAIFHAIRGLLALEGVDYSKHAGVMSHFQKNYVKTEIFGREYSEILTDAFEIRSDADYDDYYELTDKEVTEQIESAMFFVKGISEYAESLIAES